MTRRLLSRKESNGSVEPNNGSLRRSVGRSVGRMRRGTKIRGLRRKLLSFSDEMQTEATENSCNSCRRMWETMSETLRLLGVSR